MSNYVVSTKFDAEVDALLRDFVNTSGFSQKGGFVTDLDGTVVKEKDGRVFIARPVEYGLRAIYKAGRPIILNSLRFPLSVIKTFGREWFEISGVPVPVVSMNGSQTGYLTPYGNGELSFDEIDAFPLATEEIDEILVGIEGLLKGDVKDVLLFYYPRDWRMGEIIWTPAVEKIEHVKAKYLSASAVSTVTLEKLREQLHADEICMIFLLIERSADDLMAYQHSKPSSFFTHKGVDKLEGARRIAKHLSIDLHASIGAGDSPMDSFLDGVGLMVQVGNMSLDFKGTQSTIKLKDPSELGDLLFRIAELQQENSNDDRSL